MERTLEKPDQVRKYVLQSLFSLIIGMFLLASGLWELFFNPKTSFFLTLLVICFGIVSLVIGLRQWFRLSWNKVLFVEKRAVSLRDGELAINEPASPYELWMFCDVPFFYYNGFIQINRNFGKESQIIKVPRRSPWLMWWWRSQLYGPPIIWRLSADKLNVQGRCSIKFNLLPTFTNTIFSDVVPAHDVELVTVLVKSA